MKYSIGIALDNYDMLKIDSEELETLHGDTVLVVLGEESSTKLHEYYSKIRKLIINGNKTILIIDGEKSKIRKHISMLMVSYDVYDIYVVDSLDDIDNEYIETIESRRPTIDEVTEYIGADVSAYAEINKVLLRIDSACRANSLDELSKIVYENKDLIENTVVIVDYMKKVVDSANSGTTKKIEELKDELNNLERKVKEYEVKMDKLRRELEMSREEKEDLLRDARTYTKRCQELEEQVNKSGPIIKAYSTLQASSVKGFKPKAVIYFKEISKIPYINSFVLQLLESIRPLSKSLNTDIKARLVIYDSVSEYQVYKPLTVVESSILTGGRKQEIINSNDKIVIAEPNQALLEDILKANYDVVIIYDRLKQQRDLISGNLVYKFYVANSNADIKAIQTVDKCELSRIITTPGTTGGCMALPTISEYKSKSPSAKLAAYMQVKDCNNKNVKLIDNIHKIVHLKSL